MMTELKAAVLRQDVGLWIFRISYTIFLLFSFFGHIAGLGGYLKLIENGSLGLLLFGLIIRLPVYTAREISIIVGFGILAALVARGSNDFMLIKLVLLLSAAKGIELRRCVRLDVMLRSVLIPAVLCLGLLGLAPDAVSPEPGGRLRHSMGFTNPNTLGLACTLLCLEILYLNRMRWSRAPVTIAVAITLAVDRLAGSRTAEIIVVLALALSALNTVRPDLFRGNAFRGLVQWFPPLAGALTYVAVRFFVSGHPVALAANEALSNRLKNIARHSRRVSVTMFGNDLARHNLTLDSAYAYLVLGLGAVTSACFLVLMAALARRLQRTGDTPLLIVLLCLLAYGLSERLWMNVDYDILMLCLGTLMYDDDYSRSAHFDPERANAEFLKGVIGIFIGAVIVFALLFAASWVCHAAGWVDDDPTGGQTPAAQTTEITEGE